MSVRPGGGGDFLAAVFDGHRGQEVVAHNTRNVSNYVWGSRFWPASPGDALSDAVLQCHETARKDKLCGGSTAVLIAFHAGTIWVCSAGDSRVVAGLQFGGVQRLSVDHRADSKEERERIRAAGGSVEWGNVGGVLPMSRGIGNYDLERAGFACLPYVGSVAQSEVEFVVLASDGLWDVIDDSECCELVRRFCAVEGCSNNSNKVAEHLVEQALDRWAKRGSADDIAVVVTFFSQQAQRAMDLCSPAQSPQMFMRPIPSNEEFNPPDVPFGIGTFAAFGQLGSTMKPPPPLKELPFSAALEAAESEMAEGSEKSEMED